MQRYVDNLCAISIDTWSNQCNPISASEKDTLEKLVFILDQFYVPFEYVICCMATEGYNVFEAVMARCALQVDEVGLATCTMPGVVGVTREELVQLLDDYCLDRRMMNNPYLSDSDSGAEDADRATVVIAAIDNCAAQCNNHLSQFFEEN